ncbi:MAG: hypothetical protein AAF843_03775 [Bacteroidota bacterium]
MKVTENGSFTINDDEILLDPTKWSGIGKFGTLPEGPVSNDEQLEDRSYQWVIDGDNLLLYGRCGDFQIDLGCSGASKFLSGFERSN